MAASSTRTITLKFKGDIADLVTATVGADSALKRVDDTAGKTDGFDKLNSKTEDTAKSFSLIPLAAGAAGALGGAALVAGVGVGLAAIVAGIESTNQKVESSFGDLSQGLADELKSAAAPLTGDVLNGISELSGEAQKAKPQLDAMFSAIGPEIPLVAKGIGDMANNLLPGMTAAAKNSTPVIGSLDNLLANLGTDGSKTLTTLSQDSVNYGKVLDSLGSIADTSLNLVANVANDAANIWAKAGPAIDATVNTLGNDVGQLASSASGPLASGLGATATAANLALHALQPLDGLLGQVGGEALATYGSFRLFGTLGGLVGSAGTAISKFSNTARIVTTDLTGSAYAGASAGTAVSKFGSAVSGAAKALPLIGVAVTLGTQAFQAAVGTMDEYTSQLEKTGQLTAAQSGTLTANTGVVNALSFGNKGLQSALASIIPTQQSVNQAYKDYENTLDPIQRAQQSATQAQTAYNLAVGQYGTDSKQAQAALAGVSFATAAVNEATDAQVGKLNLLATGSKDSASNINTLAGYEKTLESNSSSANDKVSALQASVKLLGENGQEAANDAVAAMYTQLNGLKSSLDGTTGSLFAANGQLDLTSTKGETARSTVENLAQNLALYNQNVVQQGNSQDFANTQTQAMIDQMAGPLAQNLGISKQKAEDLINEYYKTPPSVNTDFTNNAPQAQGQVKALNDQINGLNKSVQIIINEVIKPVASGSGGSVYTPFSLPGKAVGGPVVAGRSYLVGEKGREVFTPNENGTITPNDETEKMLSGASSPGASAASGSASTGTITIPIDISDQLRMVVQAGIDANNRVVWQKVKAGAR